MAGASKILPVPYFVQPTGVTCQSTVLKMFASYLEQNVVFQCTGAADRNIQDIWKDVNQGTGRPSKMQNAHANMKWWLERHFTSLKFKYVQSRDEADVTQQIIRFIDSGFPVLVAVSHINVAGHIVLVVGYENYVRNMSSADFKMVIHDPYGKLDPGLNSKLFGKKRWDGGSSTLQGDQTGPGRGVRLPITAASRQRPGDAALGTFYLISATR